MAKFSCIFLLTCFLTIIGANSTPRGAQVRLTSRGLNYGLSLGVRRLEKDLTNKRLGRQGGRMGDISFSADNVVINYFRVGSSSVRPLSGNGVVVSMGGMNVQAHGKIHGQFQKGWFKVGYGTNVRINLNSLSFTLRFNVGARSGKPQLSVQSCASNIGDIGLNFSGPLGWVYNVISGLFKGQIKDVLKKVMCDEAMKLINTEANNFLKGFPVQQKIENYAYINYAFQKPETTPNYIDFLLRGEFLAPNRPVPSTKTPPSFGTTADSSRMAYVWITDFTLNSAGQVFHETGLLNKFISPFTDKVPSDIKRFLNTRSFEKIIPELFQQFPNRTLEFQIATNQAPTFKINSGKVDVLSNARATVFVNKPDGSKSVVFYLDITVDASGAGFVKTKNNQLYVGGKVKDFTFGAKIGGSILGEINIPLDDPSIKQLVRGLVVESANLIMGHGFPVPRVLGLSFINPRLSFVQNAIRVDTDIKYIG